MGLTQNLANLIAKGVCGGIVSISLNKTRGMPIFVVRLFGVGRARLLQTKMRKG